MAHVRVLTRFVRESILLRTICGDQPHDQRFVRAVYRALLNREPDAEGLDYYLRRLRNRQVSRFATIRSVLASAEFRAQYTTQIPPLEALHRARVLLFQQCLPPAERIVDLGGAAHDFAEGALRAMGYPHRPREITIIDLPPPDRIGGSERAEPLRELHTPDGVHIRYLYGSMTDLAAFPDNSVDLVVSGESIKHISEHDADIVCREAYRVLEPGGSFCLDTPNASLTRLQSPNALIHPEHQKEYYVHELRAKVEQCGFTLVEAKGICPMPQSLTSGVFDLQELASNIALSDNPQLGYLFYLRAVKPQRS